jgi:hypothetical protein
VAEPLPVGGAAPRSPLSGFRRGLACGFCLLVDGADALFVLADALLRLFDGR